MRSRTWLHGDTFQLARVNVSVALQNCRTALFHLQMRNTIQLYRSRHAILIYLNEAYDHLLPWLHKGSTVYDYEQPCPENWTLETNSDCVAPLSYSGPCIPRKCLASRSTQDKRIWALKCRSPWPLQHAKQPTVGAELELVHACVADYAQPCLSGWVFSEEGSLCLAPSDYQVWAQTLSCPRRRQRLLLLLLQGTCALRVASADFTIEQKQVCSNLSCGTADMTES